MFPPDAYRRAFEALLDARGERAACRDTVALLALAHERGCEAALARELDACLEAGALPDPEALTALFAPGSSPLSQARRVFLYFTPTSASWANLVEHFLAMLTDKQIRRGVFTSVPHLEKCLRENLGSHNKNPSLRLDEDCPGDHRQGRTCTDGTGQGVISLLLFRTH